MHPAVAKAEKIGNLAIEHGWTGHLESQMISNRRITTFGLDRGEEHLTITWTRNDISNAVYDIRGDTLHLKTNRQLKFAIIQPYQPKLNEVLEQFSEDLIIANLLGRDIFWWESVESAVRHDHVLFKQTAKCRLAPVNHRHLFHFVGAQAGFRSVLLDTIIKVI